jgi:hypothetical protein
MCHAAQRPAGLAQKMHLTRSQTLALVEMLKVNLMLIAKLMVSVIEKAKLEYILTKY